MLDYLIKQKETDNKNLSKEFENWLFRDRGRQIKGIKYFLNKRSESIDKLIIDSAYESNLNTINNFGIFTVGGYGRGELHPYSDIDLLLLSKENLSRADQKKIETFISLLWDLGLDIGHSVRTLEQAISHAREDVYTMTNMLEYRKIYGNDGIHRDYISVIDTNNLWRNTPYRQAKILEQT